MRAPAKTLLAAVHVSVRKLVFFRASLIDTFDPNVAMWFFLYLFLLNKKICGTVTHDTNQQANETITIINHRTHLYTYTTLLTSKDQLRNLIKNCTVKKYLIHLIIITYMPFTWINQLVSHYLLRKLALWLTFTSIYNTVLFIISYTCNIIIVIMTS